MSDYLKAFIKDYLKYLLAFTYGIVSKAILEMNFFTFIITLFGALYIIHRFWPHVLSSSTPKSPERSVVGKASDESSSGEISQDK